MAQRGYDSLRKLTDRGQSNRSSRMRVLTPGRAHSELSRGTTSTIQNRRKNMHFIEHGVDLTPKFLTNRFYPPIEEKQLTAFDTIGMSQNGSTTQLAVTSPGNEVLRMSSVSLIRSSSVQTNVLPYEETMESILSAQGGIGSLQELETDKSPSQFCLARYDSTIFYMKPENVTIIIKETETFFLFEMPQLTADLTTAEGSMVKEANERYRYITMGGGSNRKLVNAETQTPKIHTKPRSTYVGHERRHNRGTFVTNWVMHDTYADSEFAADGNERHVVHSSDSMTQMIKTQGQQNKFTHDEFHLGSLSVQDHLAHIYDKTSFRDAVRVMERIIASNLYIIPQKRYKGLIQKDPCSLDLEFTYSLDLLWTHSCTLTQYRKVSCVKWNPMNASVLAAGYGASPSEKNGILLIWCMKNPSQPDRTYRFTCPISDANWSRKKSNQLAIGFYDGTINVVDVSKKDLVVLRKSSRQTSPSYSPHWQVQWWFTDEQYEYQEHIYTSNQDGRIICYRNGEDFTSLEIMRITRIEGEIVGIKRTNHCNLYNIPISQNPGAVLLRRHPDQSTIYFVGTDEGCIHRCSINYLHQNIESFLVHDGSIYSFEFSPFCSKIFLTCGADWCTRIWLEGITEPLITLSTQMACVRGAAWSRINSTVVASIVNNEICIWDIKRKTYRPTSITVSLNSHVFSSINFTNNGKQLVAADVNGDIHMYSLEGMPFAPLDQTLLLVESIEKALVTKPALLQKFRKIGSPFGFCRSTEVPAS